MIPTESRASWRRDAARSIVGAGDVVIEGAVVIVPSLTDVVPPKGYGSVPQVRRAGRVGRVGRRLPQVRLAAGPVADDVQGVEVVRVAGSVEDPGAALRRALP